MLYVSVCLGCYNKLPETECLSTTEIISHSSGGWTSEIKVLGDSVFSEGLFPGTKTGGGLLTVSSQGGGGGELSEVSFLGTPTPFMRALPYHLTAS